MDKYRMVENYFSSWVHQNRNQFDNIFSDKIVYSEYFGPEYHGLEQIKKWFDDWNKRGKVLIWNIKNFYQDHNTAIVEWYFKYDYDGSVGGFDGVSLILFSDEDKMISIKEFQSKSEHYSPYK